MGIYWSGVMKQGGKVVRYFCATEVDFCWLEFWTILMSEMDW